MALRWKKAVTDAGMNLLTRINGKKFSITRVIAGAGTAPDDALEQQIEVIDPKAELTIKSISNKNNSRRLRLSLDSANVSAGFNLYQIGIYAQLDEEPEVLYKILQAAIPDYVPSRDESESCIMDYNDVIFIGNASAFSATIDPAGNVTLGQLEELLENSTTIQNIYNIVNNHVVDDKKHCAGESFWVRLPKESWVRNGVRYVQQYIPPALNPPEITAYMLPLIGANSMTVAQMVDEKININAENDKGLLAFNAFGVVPTIDLMVQVTLARLQENPSNSNPYYSNMLGSPSGIGTPLPAPITVLQARNTSTHTQISITANWTNPTVDFAAVRVVRAEGNTAPADPDSGTRIVDGANVTSFKDTASLEVGKSYSYSWFARNTAGNYQMDFGYATVILATDIPSPPTNLAAIDSTDSGAFAATLTWGAPVDVYRHHFALVRKNGSAPTALSDGQIVWEGTALTYRDAKNMTFDLTYYYAIFAVNSAGQASTGVQTSITLTTKIPQTVPSLSLEDKSSKQEGYQIKLTGQRPSDVNFYKFAFVMKSGSAPTSSVDGTKIYEGEEETFLYSLPYTANTLHFRAFSLNRKGQFNSELTAASTKSITLTAGKPSGITALAATDDRGTTTVSWKNPTVTVNGVEMLDKFLAGVRVVQKVNSKPTNENDGTIIYDGIATGMNQSASRSGQPNGANIYIVVFTKNHAGTYFLSFGQMVNVTPIAIPTFRYNGQYELIKDDESKGKWRIKFKTSGTFVLLTPDTLDVDVFLVGGGGGGKLGGGGGGYTKTFRRVRIVKNTDIPVSIGAGGGANISGGSTFFKELSVEGGKTPANANNQNPGGNGGSGGGAPTTNDGTNIRGMNGGSNGSDGQNAYSYNGGKGQVTTTREFEDPDGEVYSGGGGGNAGAGGFGGFGGGAKAQAAVNGIGGQPGKNSSRWTEGNLGGPGSYIPSYGGGGGGGYGGGGGGGCRFEYIGATITYYYDGGAGFQGIAIIRDAR